MINDQQGNLGVERQGRNKENRTSRNRTRTATTVEMARGTRHDTTRHDLLAGRSDESYEPLKAATTLFRSCGRTEGGPPDGGLDEG
jgi:hypothetical protein